MWCAVVPGILFWDRRRWWPARVAALNTLIYLVVAEPKVIAQHIELVGLLHGEGSLLSLFLPHDGPQGSLLSLVGPVRLYISCGVQLISLMEGLSNKIGVIHLLDLPIEILSVRYQNDDAHGEE